MRYRFGGVELDERRRELRRRGQAIALEPQVFDLLLYLVRNRDRVVAKEELLDRLWPDEEVMEGALAVCVHRVRLALGNDVVIRTFSGRGYRFAVDVVELPDPGAQEFQTAGPPLYRWIGSYVRAMRAIMAGRFAEAKRLAAEARAAGAGPAGEVAEAAFGTQLSAIRTLQGRSAELAPLVEGFVARYPARDIGRATLASLYCELGRQDEARMELDLLEGTLLDGERTSLWLHTVVSLARPCSRLRHTRLAAALFEQLKPFADACVVVPVAVAFNGPVAIYLGLLAETVGRTKEASRYFEKGMETCERLGAHPTLAQAQYEYARALMAHGGRANRAKALTFLTEAEGTALNLEMTGLSKWIEQLRTGTNLGGGGHGHAAEATSTENRPTPWIAPSLEGAPPHFAAAFRNA